MTMSESFFSVLLSALAVFVIALYYLFFKKVKEEGKQDDGKSIFYFLLVVSGILVIWGIISIISAFIKGIEINVNRPHLILFIMSIFIVFSSSYDLVFRKKKWPQYSWFIAYFLLAYCSVIVIWGIVSFIAT
jgi:hypothetical protein